MRLLGIACSLLLPSCALSKAILGVDLGSLYMKVALVQRNSPLEIVTNLHSKRKTEQMVLFDAGTRFYGADANSLVARKPLLTPSGMSLYLGRTEEHPAVEVLSSRRYPINPTFNETRSGVCLTVAGEQYTPEELVAMVLNHAKDITAAYASGAQVKDCVLTVPSFYTQHERRALLDAASLADLNVLALIDETTAAGLHFGIDRIDKEPINVLFYNMGASALQVNIIKYHSYERKESKYAKPKTVGAFQVLGKAWDATLGGHAFDAKILDHMAEEFNGIWNKKRNDGQTKDVRDYPRPMAKLRIQANKVKHVLSANTDVPIFIDALHDDTNYQSHMNRATLEEICHDLFLRAAKPIQQALQSANMTLDELDSIELIGGGMRIPKIQEEIVKSLDNKLKLGMHINSDESMALGAAFHGANVSTAFRVRHVGMTDINPFPVSISLQNLPEQDNKGDGMGAALTGLFGLGKKQPQTDNEGDESKEEEAWSKQATIFKANGKLGVKKTIAFTHDQNVACSVDYEDSNLLPIGTGNSVERYSISGIDDFAKEMADKGLSKPKVSLQFELSTSGLTQLVKAEAAVEEIYTVQEEVEVDDEEDKSGDEENNNDIENNTNDSASESITENAADEETDTENKEDDPSDSKNETKKEEEKITKKKKIMVDKEKKKIHRRVLTIKTYHTGIVKPYSTEIMAESRAKLAELARKDKELAMLEEARNKYEGYIYHIKNKLIDEEEAIGAVSTLEQREALLKSAEESEEWMYEDGYDADLETFNSKYLDLSEPAEKIFFRVKEATARPEAIKALQTKLKKVIDLMTKWEKTMEHITQEEREEVLAKVEDVRKWITEKEEAQAAVDPTTDPIFTSDEVPTQTKPIEILVGTLSRKPKPKPKVEKTEEKKNESETDDGGETEEKDASEAEEKPADTDSPEDAKSEEEKKEDDEL
eukprot:CAMPEP_0184862262 /NCGR_PEP_ID=MMETSP0580-20130426/6742_1 /TAXON_ID=1118495 /ORGANISM="Dactyliosolen fragilissimus" /LENGTH=937 /DNA_ID=CAMNT_0027360033 /DNA_START=157 /DNA_END=2970 /DNA_ORIENTATION=+